MTAKSDHDLLIGIGKDIISINARLKKIETKQSCETNREKIRTLERITWGALAAAIVAGVKAFWPGGP